MSYGQPFVFKSDKAARSQPQEYKFILRITGAKTNASISLINLPVLAGYDATDLTQALVEAFLGATSTAACATIFDSTSMGTDTLGFVIALTGQVDKVYAMKAKVIQSAGGTPANSDLLVQATQGALTSSNTSALAVYDGNVYGRIVAGNLDSATAGFIEVTILFKSK